MTAKNSSDYARDVATFDERLRDNATETRSVEERRCQLAYAAATDDADAITELRQVEERARLLDTSSRNLTAARETALKLQREAGEREKVESYRRRCRSTQVLIEEAGCLSADADAAMQKAAGLLVKRRALLEQLRSLGIVEGQIIDGLTHAGPLMSALSASGLQEQMGTGPSSAIYGSLEDHTRASLSLPPQARRVLDDAA